MLVDSHQKLVALGLSRKSVDHRFGGRLGLTPLLLIDQGVAQGDECLHAVRIDLEDLMEDLDPPLRVPLSLEFLRNLVILCEGFGFASFRSRSRAWSLSPSR